MELCFGTLYIAAIPASSMAQHSHACLCRALELSEGSAAALLDYCLAALPHQRGETGALAAHTLLASLLGAAQPAAALQAGGALLHHYLAEDLTKVCCPGTPLSG